MGDFLNISVSQIPSEHSKTHFPANLSRPKFVKIREIRGRVFTFIFSMKFKNRVFQIGVGYKF